VEIGFVLLNAVASENLLFLSLGRASARPFLRAVDFP
jgi:hypothetical protein